MIYEKLGERVRELRKDNHMSQEDLAAMIKVDVRYMMQDIRVLDVTLGIKRKFNGKRTKAKMAGDLVNQAKPKKKPAIMARSSRECLKDR